MNYLRMALIRIEIIHLTTITGRYTYFITCDLVSKEPAIKSRDIVPSAWQYIKFIFKLMQQSRIPRDIVKMMGF
jgi:hypothetical protein